MDELPIEEWAQALIDRYGLPGDAESMVRLAAGFTLSMRIGVEEQFRRLEADGLLARLRDELAAGK